MADKNISNITVNGINYDIKDKEARNELSQLSDLAKTGSFTDLQNKPTTIEGYGITDAASTSDISALSTAVQSVKLEGSSVEYKSGTDVVLPAYPVIEDAYDASTSHAMSGKAVASAISSKAESSELISHTSNAEIHVTKEDKEKWNAAEANVQSDWNASSGAAAILNKPAIPNAQTVTGWGFATATQVDGKVDKVTGKSLISDTEITRLASVHNYDDTEIKNSIPKQASDIGALSNTTTHLSGDVPVSRTVNGKALSTDITLSASDIGALSDTTDLSVFALASEVGYDLGLTIDAKTYVMTLELKNKSGVVISTKTLDFPIESMVVNASYKDGKITLTLQSGSTVDVDITALVSGLVNDSFTIAGIDMKDNITAAELKTALGIPSSYAPTNAQANVIETIKVNNTALTPTSKTVNITVPTKASDIGAMASTVTHLSGDVPTTRTVNGKALSADIILSASDVGALPNSTTIPTVTDTYSSTSSSAMSGKAVASAIDNKMDKTTVLTGGSQTSTSSADGGSNVYTFTKSDGTTSTLTVKNGSKGSKGDTGAAGTNGTNGKDGTSVSISSTSITYQASSSGTTTPTGTWSTTVPSVTKGQYLWTKTVVTYSNGSSTTAYSVGYQGTNGTNGTNGKDGTNGTNGTNGTSAAWFTGTAVTGTATSGISATVSGSKANDMYLNTSTSNVYKASAANTWGYVCNIKGATGSQGNPGTNGTTPTIKAANGTNIGTVGTPSVSASTSGTTTTFTFNYLKGVKGDKGDPGQNATTTAVVSTSANGLAPKVTDTTKYLRGDGTWATPTNTTYTNMTLGNGYGTCTTAAATAAKVVTLSNYVLSTGGIVAVKFTYAVPANATMNINSKGAKNIYFNGSAITANIIPAGAIATFIYDGTQYHLITLDKIAKASVSGTKLTLTI